jgi:hypothetical protein
MRRDLAARHPENPGWREDVARSLGRIAELLEKLHPANSP